MAADTLQKDASCNLVNEIFPEIPHIPAILKLSVVNFFSRWQEFTAKRGATVNFVLYLFCFCQHKFFNTANREPE